MRVVGRGFGPARFIPASPAGAMPAAADQLLLKRLPGPDIPEPPAPG
jgi:hypothetical protein